MLLNGPLGQNLLQIPEGTGHLPGDGPGIRCVEGTLGRLLPAHLFFETGDLAFQAADQIVRHIQVVGRKTRQDELELPSFLRNGPLEEAVVPLKRSIRPELHSEIRLDRPFKIRVVVEEPIPPVPKTLLHLVADPALDLFRRHGSSWTDQPTAAVVAPTLVGAPAGPPMGISLIAVPASSAFGETREEVLRFRPPADSLGNRRVYPGGQHLLSAVPGLLRDNRRMSVVDDDALLHLPVEEAFPEDLLPLDADAAVAASAFDRELVVLALAPSPVDHGAHVDGVREDGTHRRDEPVSAPGRWIPFPTEHFRHRAQTAAFLHIQLEDLVFWWRQLLRVKSLNVSPRPGLGGTGKDLLALVTPVPLPPSLQPPVDPAYLVQAKAHWEETLKQHDEAAFRGWMLVTGVLSLVFTGILFGTLVDDVRRRNAWGELNLGRGLLMVGVIAACHLLWKSFYQPQRSLEEARSESP